MRTETGGAEVSTEPGLLSRDSEGHTPTRENGFLSGTSTGCRALPYFRSSAWGSGRTSRRRNWRDSVSRPKWRQAILSGFLCVACSLIHVMPPPNVGHRYYCGSAGTGGDCLKVRGGWSGRSVGKAIGGAWLGLGNIVQMRLPLCLGQTPVDPAAWQRLAHARSSYRRAADLRPRTRWAFGAELLVYELVRLIPLQRFVCHVRFPAPFARAPRHAAPPRVRRIRTRPRMSPSAVAQTRTRVAGSFTQRTGNSNTR